MATVTDLLQTPHWSTDIPLETPHLRLDVLAERGFVVLARPGPAGARRRSSSASSTWTGRAAATPTSRRSPPPTASSSAGASGSRAKSAPDKGGRWTSNAPHCPTLVANVEEVGADFGRVRVIKLEPQGYEDVAAPDPPRRQQPLQPRRRRLGRAAVVRAHRQPRRVHDPHGAGRRRPPRPGHRGARRAAPRLAVRRRHPAPVARRVQPERHHALRAHRQLRERSRARRLDPRQPA